MRRGIREARLYWMNGDVRVFGPNPNLTGMTQRLRGDCSGLTGTASALAGDVTGITGDVTGLHGNLDDCDITPQDRRGGIAIDVLVEGRDG
jgi:hypothetical protein